MKVLLIILFLVPLRVFSEYKFPSIVEIWTNGEVVYGKLDNVEKERWSLAKCHVVKDEEGQIQDVWGVFTFKGDYVPSLLIGDHLFELATKEEHTISFDPININCDLSHDSEVRISVLYKGQTGIREFYYIGSSDPDFTFSPFTGGNSITTVSKHF